MRLRDVKVRTQILVGFSVILLFVVALGITSYQQTDRLSEQMRTMYNHPFKVRRALGALTADLLNMRVSQRDLMLADTPDDQQAAIQAMKIAEKDAESQFEILKSQYLGPPSDVENAYDAFSAWVISRQNNTDLVLAGNMDKAKQNMTATGSTGVYRDQMFARIKIIDDYSRKKTDALMATSDELNRVLHRQLEVMVIVILIFSCCIGYIVLQNIRRPLKQMGGAVLSFAKGDYSVRSNYTSGNEFGALSSALNVLAEAVQEDATLNEMTVNLSSAMLGDDDIRRFFQTTLQMLAQDTSAQMAGVYLLSKDQKTFDYFESVGLDDCAKATFSAETREGEFGAAIASREVQHIRAIPEDSIFNFHTVQGTFIPKEIITIPVISGSRVIAIVSLASITQFSSMTLELIERIRVMLGVRIEAILAYADIKSFQKEVENQNRELTSQKMELSAQTAELTQQNAELEVQKRQLAEASQLKTNFLSNMSHELRTPLNSVIALSGVLSRRLATQIPEEEHGYLEVIERNGKNLLLLINDILDISRIEAGREEIEISRIDMDDCVGELVEMIRPQAVQRGIALNHNHSNPSIFVTTDSSKCHHISSIIS